MNSFRLCRALAVLCGAAMLGLAGGAWAQAEREAKLSDAPPGAVRMFVSGSMLAPVLSVKPQLERATGRKIFVQSSESRNLQRDIESGQPFEVALLTSPVIKDMVAGGWMAPGSEAVVSVVLVGVSARGATPGQDVTSAEGLKAAILGAHSIRRFYGVAASTPIIDNLFEKLGLNEATRDRMVHIGSGAPPPETPLPAGQYELIINLVSAIRPMAGWTYLGLIPQQFQMPVQHSAALGAKGDQAAGRKVIEVLKSPAFEAALGENGSSR